MRQKTVRFLAAACIGAAAIGAAFARAPEPTPAAFKVDPVHSTVVFSIGHLGVSRYYGVFNMPTGTFLIDFANPSSSSLEVSIDADKIATGIGKRDDHLKSPDFFNSKEFPKIAFRATSFEKVDARRVKVKGDLTLLNVTKPVDVALEFIGEGDTAQGHKAGLEATFTIKRSDFGMTTYLEGNAIGDEVKLIVALEGKRQ
jgi:polyisoprenoid-binding protein YceI